MSAIQIPAPGTRYGQCLGECQHTDCAAARRDAARPCKVCGTPIGYAVDCGIDEDGQWAHWLCLLQQAAVAKAEGRQA